MADITVLTPVVVAPASSNWLGTKLLARGTVTVGLAAKIGNVPKGLACMIKTADGVTTIATGTMFTAGTMWWARFGTLDNVDGSTEYEILANAPTTAFDTSVTVKQIYFNSDLNVAFDPGTGDVFTDLQFSVNGTYMSGTLYTVNCYLMDAAGTVVAVGTVTLDTPQAGQWTAAFNLSSSRSNCSLVVELMRISPQESVSADWIDGVSVG
jgi:hypothetical protein